MQLGRNTNRLLAETAHAERVLDVGGAGRPLNTATHTIDALPYSDRGPVLFPDVPERFSAANWLQFDICERPWPYRLREIFHERRGYWFRRMVGRKFAVGWGHHRWFCEIEGDNVTFLAKTLTAVASRKFFITRAELGRGLTEEESAVGLFWRDRFSVREWLLIKPGETEAELARFKKEALRRLRSADQAKRALRPDAAPGARGA